jgi:hypothetical protein
MAVNITINFIFDGGQKKSVSLGDGQTGGGSGNNQNGGGAGSSNISKVEKVIWFFVLSIIIFVLPI